MEDGDWRGSWDGIEEAPREGDAEEDVAQAMRVYATVRRLCNCAKTNRAKGLARIPHRAAQGEADAEETLMAYFPTRVEQASKCPGCGRWYLPASASCCVAHAPGTCCHYGEVEVAPPEPTREGRGR